MRLISWNLLRREGATTEDVAGLIRLHQPDIMLMQEATTAQVSSLPDLVGGDLRHRLLPGRIHGLAAWVPTSLPEPEYIALPYDPRIPSGDGRLAMVLQFSCITVVNIHLSHGQGLLRRQLRAIADAVNGPCLIAGDYNCVGPILMPGWPTHRVGGIVPVRLDRCLVRGVDVRGAGAFALPRGRSDHCPIVVSLPQVDAASGTAVEEGVGDATR